MHTLAKASNAKFSEQVGRQNSIPSVIAVPYPSVTSFGSAHTKSLGGLQGKTCGVWPNTNSNWSWSTSISISSAFDACRKSLKIGPWTANGFGTWHGATIPKLSLKLKTVFPVKQKYS